MFIPDLQKIISLNYGGIHVTVIKLMVMKYHFSLSNI